MKKALLIIFSILIIDQVVKIWVKTHMYMGESIPVLGHWFYIHFTENEGMAFGMQLGGDYGKLLLSLFRIVAVIVIGVWIYRISVRGGSTLLLVCLSLIMAGALGNIIDSAFYGIIFNESTFMQVAALNPPEGGYGTFLHGKVVDMLYFPIIEGYYPEWFPWFGGDTFIFFRPVFNIADSSITVGVFMLILFQGRVFPTLKSEEQKTD